MRDKVRDTRVETRVTGKMSAVALQWDTQNVDIGRWRRKMKGDGR